MELGTRPDGFANVDVFYCTDLPDAIDLGSILATSLWFQRMDYWPQWDIHSLEKSQYTLLKVPRSIFLLIEGSIAVAGSAVKWARDQLGIIKSANEIGEIASKVKGLSRNAEKLI